MLDGWQAAIAAGFVLPISISGRLVSWVEMQLLARQSRVIVTVNQDSDLACVAPLSDVLFSLALDDLRDLLVGQPLLLKLIDPFRHFVTERLLVGLWDPTAGWLVSQRARCNVLVCILGHLSDSQLVIIGHLL